MKSLKDIAPVVGLLCLTIAVGKLVIQNHTLSIKNEKYTQDRLREKEKALKKALDDKTRAQLFRIFDIKKVPNSLQRHHHLMYVQFVKLMKEIPVSEGEAKWMMEMVENGLLHHIVSRFSILCIDNNFDPPRKGMKLTINFDWDNYKMNPIFNKEGYNSKALENQKIMDLADMFVEFLEYEDENATVTTRYQTIDTPSFKALNTLNATSFSTITEQDTTINISKDNFEKLVRKKLNLSVSEPLKWRNGDEYYFYEDSEASAGLSVSLRYVIPDKKNKKNKKKLLH